MIMPPPREIEGSCGNLCLMRQGYGEQTICNNVDQATSLRLGLIPRIIEIVTHLQ
jgi:hypothetical protein